MYIELRSSVLANTCNQKLAKLSFVCVTCLNNNSNNNKAHNNSCNR